MTKPEVMTTMHKDDRPETAAAPDAIGASDHSALPEGQSTPRSAIQVDDSKAMVCYSNFCRVTGTPEELILDFGLHAQPADAAAGIEIKQRLVVNYFTAKRLLHAVALAVQRHEGAFGVLETDVSRRLSSLARRSQAAG